MALLHIFNFDGYPYICSSLLSPCSPSTPDILLYFLTLVSPSHHPSLSLLPPSHEPLCSHLLLPVLTPPPTYTHIQIRR